MQDDSRVQVFNSQSAAYQQAFHVFLDHTDQKANARRQLEELVQELPGRHVFLDAGAGTGQVTAWFLEQFERTIAIEPNPSLCAELRRTCPGAKVLPVPINEADPQSLCDLVLCSHVLYYINRGEWLRVLGRMASWLAPQGILVVILQNHETDCMRMLDAFLGRRFDLSELAREFEAAQSQQYQTELQLVSAHVTTPDLATAYVIAEFMLNLLPMPNPPARHALEDYIRTHFAASGGGFRFSCHQDFLTIRHRERLQAL
jgi:trans-aconitate methyltransferase